MYIYIYIYIEYIYIYIIFGLFYTREIIKRSIFTKSCRCRGTTLRDGAPLTSCRILTCCAEYEHVVAYEHTAEYEHVVAYEHVAEYEHVV